MRTSFFPLALAMAPNAFAQGTFCNAQGNVAIFSNYDGGGLTINVDQDIPDLHIGIVSYEFAVIGITGPFASNVVAVQWAGYNGNNDHCGTGAITQSTVIGGVTSGISDIVVIPPASLANANGNPNIICSYSCDIDTEQGGCNTVDQVAHHFLDQWNGILLFHLTQYGCWGGVYDISDGGNCCVDPLSTGIVDAPPSAALVTLDAAGQWLTVDGPGPGMIFDAQGRSMASIGANGHANVAGLPGGIYLLRLAEGRSARFALPR
jgi:hypothetical protein